MEDGPSEGKQLESDDNSTGMKAFPVAGSDISDDVRSFDFNADEEFEKD